MTILLSRKPANPKSWKIQTLHGTYRHIKFGAVISLRRWGVWGLLSIVKTRQISLLACSVSTCCFSTLLKNALSPLCLKEWITSRMYVVQVAIVTCQLTLPKPRTPGHCRPKPHTPVLGVMSRALGSSHPPDRRKYAPISFALSPSESAFQMAVALVGNMRLE